MLNIVGMLLWGLVLGCKLNVRFVVLFVLGIGFWFIMIILMLLRVILNVLNMLGIGGLIEFVLVLFFNRWDILLMIFLIVLLVKNFFYFVGKYLWV